MLTSSADMTIRLLLPCTMNGDPGAIHAAIEVASSCGAILVPLLLRGTLNDLSGRYLYVADTGDVIDTSTLKSVKTLPALQNTRQLLEIDWANGATSATSTRFGIGRVTN